MWGTSITDQTGVEIAKSIAQNSTLQSFKIDMRSISITDQFFFCNSFFRGSPVLRDLPRVSCGRKFVRFRLASV